MKSPSSPAVDTSDDIFGPPHTGYSPPKNKFSMICPKYKVKEERRRVIKMSYSKLRKIEDPEASLCKSVLINNTMKRLEKEAKEQKHYTSDYYNENYLTIKNEYYKSDFSRDSDCESSEDDDFSDEGDRLNDFPAENDKNSMEKLSGLVEENLNKLNCSETEEKSVSERLSSKKRSYDDMDDCDVDVLSQFYMPPTPRLLTCIDEDDEDVIVVDDEPLPKKAKTDQDFDSVNNYLNNNCPSVETPRLRYPQPMEDSNSYSCGHASLFNELQNHHYHNLIASLET